MVGAGLEEPACYLSFLCAGNCVFHQLNCSFILSAERIAELSCSDHNNLVIVHCLA